MNKVLENLEIACKAFLYDDVRQACLLLDERTKPRGIHNVVQRVGVNLYEKVCLKGQFNINIKSYGNYCKGISINYLICRKDAMPKWKRSIHQSAWSCAGWACGQSCRFT